MRLLFAALCGAAALLMAADAPNQLTEAEKREGWMLLFDGKTLDGWDGDPDIWSVRDGMIAGSTENKDIETNTFLIYAKEKFGDFELRADIKLRNHNSGIQFRSEVHPDWVVSGYQADAAEGNWWGSLYGEKTGRHVIANGWIGKGEKVVREDDWNEYVIRCKGDRITLELNGLTTVDLEDGMASNGVIAFQVHRGPPMEVYFRNIKLKKL
jgi:hypothetical protein